MYCGWFVFRYSNSHTNPSRCFQTCKSFRLEFFIVGEVGGGLLFRIRMLVYVCTLFISHINIHLT